MNEIENNQIKFKSILGVMRYLQEKGYKVSKSAIYRHRDEGKLKADIDGYYTKDFIFDYAKNYLRMQDGSAPAIKMADRDHKQAAEARKVKAQAEHWEIKTKIMRGEYVERVAFERALARRAAVFKSDIENFIRNYSGESIALTGGDATKTPDLIDFWLFHAEQWLARYAENVEFDLPQMVDVEMLEQKAG
jgi:hypothetical protein